MLCRLSVSSHGSFKVFGKLVSKELVPILYNILVGAAVKMLIALAGIIVEAYSLLEMIVKQGIPVYRVLSFPSLHYFVYTPII